MTTGDTPVHPWGAATCPVCGRAKVRLTNEGALSVHTDARTEKREHCPGSFQTPARALVGLEPTTDAHALRLFRALRRVAQLGLAVEYGRERGDQHRAHTEQWYAERLERLKDFLAARGFRSEYFQIVANGTLGLPSSANYVYEPPTYAQLLNTALHRAEQAGKDLLAAQRDLCARTLALRDADVRDGTRVVRAREATHRGPGWWLVGGGVAHWWAYGRVDGHPFYFHCRAGAASLTVARNLGADPYETHEAEGGWHLDARPFASFDEPTATEVAEVLEEALGRWRAQKDVQALLGEPVLRWSLACARCNLAAAREEARTLERDGTGRAGAVWAANANVSYYRSRRDELLALLGDPPEPR